jgi:hypothetical protein
MTSAGSDAGTGQAGQGGQRTAPGWPADAGTGLADQAAQGATAVRPPDAGCGDVPDRAPANSGPAAAQSGQPGQSADGQSADGRPADGGPAVPQPADGRSAAAQPADGRPAATQPVSSGPVLSEQSREDTDIAWGDYRGRDDEDRDRLYRDRPPHWVDY